MLVYLTPPIMVRAPQRFSQKNDRIILQTKMKALITLAGTTALIVGSTHAATIFETLDANTTQVSNLNNAGETLANVAITGDTVTSTLLISDTNGNFNNGGIVSTDDINLLNTLGLTAIEQIILTLTVDSITDGFRSNDVKFGLTDDATAFGVGALGLGISVRVNYAIATLTTGFGTADPFTVFSVN